MDRKAHLLFCEKCVNRKFDSEKGVVCKLTNEQADFEAYCSDFKENKLALEKLHAREGKVGGWVRFANFIIDRIASYVIAMLLGAFIAIVNMELLESISDFADTLLTLLIYVLYYIVLEYHFQITLGKLITGTVVVDLEGNKPTLKAIVGRSFSRIVPFEAFSFLGTEASGWHDTWSKTRVVKKSSLKNNFSIDSDILDQEFMKE